jgi:Holliday junction DNA helicase RuvA
VIAFLRGTVVASGTTVVVDVGGIGMEVHPTARLAASAVVGEPLTIPAAMVVREDAWTLYGFCDADERAMFLAMQTAKGVGPRVAINLLSAMTPDELRAAVHTGNAAALTVAPGVGAKGAARLVIDLRDRLGAPTGAAAARPGQRPAPAAGGWQGDLSAALAGLGWTAQEAAAAVAAVAPQTEEGGSARRPDGTPDLGALLKLAMAHLAPGRRTEAVR